MKGIADSHVKHYRSNFEYDVQTLREAALKPERTDRTFVWLCRECGTWLLKEKDVFIQGTRENNTFCFYAEQTSDNILAFVVEVTALNGDAATGNLYCLCYPDYYKHVSTSAVPAGSIIITYERGQKTIPPTQRFTAYPDYELGGFESFEFQPESPEQLECVLTDEKRTRNKFKEDYEVLGYELYEIKDNARKTFYEIEEIKPQLGSIFILDNNAGTKQKINQTFASLFTKVKKIYR